MVWNVQKRPINVIVRRSSKIVRNDFKALNLIVLDQIKRKHKIHVIDPI